MLGLGWWEPGAFHGNGSRVCWTQAGGMETNITGLQQGWKNVVGYLQKWRWILLIAATAAPLRQK